MNTWLKDQLPEEWPEPESTSNSSENNDRSQNGSTVNPTVAIDPDRAQVPQWKQMLGPSKGNAEHLNGLFDNGDGAEDLQGDENETSATCSDLSSVDEQTRKLKLFTNTKNTFTNECLHALTTSLQGHANNEDQSDIVGDLMNGGNKALSRIRKASNMDLRRTYEPSQDMDSSLNDLNALDEHSPNGSTLSSLTDRETTSNSVVKSPKKQQSSLKLNTSSPDNTTESFNPTVRFKTPSKTPEPETDRETDVPSLAIVDPTFDIEQKPFMSFVNTSGYEHDAMPITTSASEASGTAIRPPARQVRRDTMIHSHNSRPTSILSSKSSDPRPSALSHSQKSHSREQLRSEHGRQYSAKFSMGTVNSAINALNAASNSSVDKVFDVSVNVNAPPLRDVPLPSTEKENLSISRKNVSFSGHLYYLVQQVRNINDDNAEFEVDLSNTGLECVNGLDELLPNLAKANLSQNNIQVVEGLSPSLLEVDLSENSLNRITAFPLSFITTLNVSHNDLEDLNGLKNLRALCQLDISHNKLKSLRGIESLYSLQTLNVANNSLKSLKISHPKLQHLKASSNNIESVLLKTPNLDTVDLDDNQILSLDALSSVKKLSIRNNTAKINFSEWRSLEELYYDGNNTAMELANVNPTILSWVSEQTNGFDASCLSSATILSISSKIALQSLNSGILPIQQLDLVGMSLKHLPARLPTSLPNLRCLNLAFNQLDDTSLKTLSEFTNIRTLGLFGNKVSNPATLSVYFGKLPNLGALDLRGNPATDSLYPDMATLLLESKQGTYLDQYNKLLQIEWQRVIDEWRKEPGIAERFDEYYKSMKSLKLWWLDGATINSTPPRSKFWSHSRGQGLAALEPLRTTADRSATSSSYQILAKTPSEESRMTEDFDMRHKFETPSQFDLATPSRVHGQISTIGKRKAQLSRTIHSTPAPPAAAVADHAGTTANSFSTPHTVRKEKVQSVPKNTSRARKISIPIEKIEIPVNPLQDTLRKSTAMNAEHTADMLLALLRLEYGPKNR